VTVKVIAVLPVQVKVDVPEPVILAGERSQEIPVDGEAAHVSDTVAVNPFTGATVTFGVAGEPTSTVTLLGLTLTVKSTTWNVTADW
jgi:hypothetical protein